MTVMTISGQWMDAVEFFNEMVRRGVRPRPIAVACALRACDNVKEECTSLVQTVQQWSTTVEDVMGSFGEAIIQHIQWVKGSANLLLFSAWEVSTGTHSTASALETTTRRPLRGSAAKRKSN